jgi:hypothetical protein
MNKPLNYRIMSIPKIKKELLQLIGQHPGVDYYSLIKLINTNATDVADCLGRLVLAGELVKLKDTPNPTYQLFENREDIE